MRLLPLTGLLLIVSIIGTVLALTLVRIDSTAMTDTMHVNYPRQSSPHMELHPSYSQANKPAASALPLTSQHGLDQPAALFNQEGSTAPYRYPATGRTYVF